MSVRRVAVRLIAEGGQQLRAELEGVGERGARGMRRIESETQAANRRLARFARRARMAFAAVSVAAGAAAAAMVRSGLQTVDAQAKAARSLGTTTEAMQVLDRAANMAGISVSQITRATEAFTRRLSQAAAGGGPAVDALGRLQLSAEDLLGLEMDERIRLVQERLREFVPAAQQAAVMSDLFGRRAGILMDRLDADTLATAADDVRDFGVAVSEVDAAQIQRTNDAISRLGLIWRGLSNQLAVAAAPALEAVADALAEMARVSGPVGRGIRLVFDNLGRLVSTATAFVAFLAARWVVAFTRAAAATLLLATNLGRVRAALIRTGFGALIVAAGELVYWFGRLSAGAGNFGEAMGLLKDLAVAAWREIGQGGRALLAAMRAVGWGVAQAFVDGFRWIAEQWDDLINWMLTPFNNLMEAMDREFRLVAESPLSRLLGTASDELERRGVAAAERAGEIFAGMEQTQAALEALRQALSNMGDEDGALEDAIDAADALTDAFDAAGAAAGRAGADAAAGAEEAATGWAAATRQLEEYVERARDWGSQLGDVLVSGFRRAEDAVAEFVTKGTLDFRGMVNAMIADLARLAARSFIFAPLANMLRGALGSGGGFLGALGGALGGATSFDRGGHTGYGARTGGLDGLGGRLALVHPRERIIDETRPQPAPAEAPVAVHFHGVRDVPGFRQSRAQIAADISRAVAAGRRGI